MIKSMRYLLSYFIWQQLFKWPVNQNQLSPAGISHQNFGAELLGKIFHVLVHINRGILEVDQPHVLRNAHLRSKLMTQLLKVIHYLTAFPMNSGLFCFIFICSPKSRFSSSTCVRTHFFTKLVQNKLWLYYSRFACSDPCPVKGN